MILPSAVARTIVTTLAEIGIYAAVIFAAILAFRFVCKSKMKPALRFGLWFLLLLRLTVPFTVNTAVHFVVLPAAEPVSAAEETEPAAVPDPTAYTAVAISPKPSDTQEMQPVSQNEAQQTRPSGMRITVWQILFSVWIIGAAALLIRRFWRQALLTARLRSDARTPDAQNMREFEALCSEMRIKRRVRILAAEDIASPALTVGFRPTVLLPAYLTEADRRQERRFALMHELTHLKRGDHLVLLWYEMLQCVWWFHPVIWLMKKPFRTDMEAACDAKAVLGMDREEKLAYAGFLLELGKERSEGTDVAETRTNEKTEGDYRQ